MKPGDLVKRDNLWVRYNSWMKEYVEYGIILDVPDKIVFKPCILVLWSKVGIIKEHPDDIEVINESR